MKVVVWRERRKLVYTEIVVTPLCFGGRSPEAEGDLEVETAEGAGTALEDITAVSPLGSPWVFPHRVVVLLLCSVALEAALKAQILFSFCFKL